MDRGEGRQPRGLAVEDWANTITSDTGVSLLARLADVKFVRGVSTTEVH
jgi:hypothetical protein